MMRLWLTLAALLSFLVAPGAGSAQVAGQPSAAPTTQSASDYRVGPGDVLKVTVYRAPDYDSVAQVAEDGTIAISVIGRIKVDGLTPAAVGAAIAGRLEEGGIFRSPVVNVLVQEYHSSTVTILGKVERPGEYPLERQRLTITELLARAGATLGTGGGTIRIIAADGTKEEYPAEQVLTGAFSRAARPRDTILVTEPASFYISGEVQRAGSYPLEPGLTIGRAIALAGGLTPRGARNRVKVTRREGDVEKLLPGRTTDPVLPSDLLVVGARIF